MPRRRLGVELMLEFLCRRDVPRLPDCALAKAWTRSRRSNQEIAGHDGGKRRSFPYNSIHAGINWHPKRHSTVQARSVVAPLGQFRVVALTKPFHDFATCTEVPVPPDSVLSPLLGKPMRVEAPSDVKQGQSFTLPLAEKSRSE